MTDILDRIDEALDGHNEVVFAGAMKSVRDAIDGAWASMAICDPDDCPGVGGGDGYPCADTLARWRPPETRESEPEIPWPEISWGDSIVMGSPDRLSASWSAPLNFTVEFDAAPIMRAMERMTVQVATAFERARLDAFVQAPGLFGSAGPFYDETRTPSASFTLGGRRVDVSIRTVPDLVPPAREHWDILHWHEVLSAQAPEMPEASWRAKQSVDPYWAVLNGWGRTL